MGSFLKPKQTLKFKRRLENKVCFAEIVVAWAQLRQVFLGF